MEETAIVAGVEISPEDWEKRTASVKALIKQLENRLTELEERLGLTSKNSSCPLVGEIAMAQRVSAGKMMRGKRERKDA